MKKGWSYGLRTWVEVDEQALKHNFRVFRSFIPKKVMFGAVVKSNAYGHDLSQLAKLFEKLGVDWIMVDSIVEASTLRAHGIKKPLLILGYILPTRMGEAIKLNTSITISNIKGLESATKEAQKLKRQIKIHIKIDSGLSRRGFLISDQQKFLALLRKNSEWIKTDGLYTHFSAAKNPAFPESVQRQLKIFQTWVDLFKEKGFQPIVHSAATGATLLFPETHFDMVRIGIGLYGLWPSLETKQNMEGKIILKPVLTWKTIVSEVKRRPKGTKVGYDGSETLSKNSQLALCPVGYWHGFSRKLSSIAHVLIGGKRAKVIGRVSMDMIIVDVTSIPHVKEGSEVVLIGKQGQEEVTAYEMAGLDSTSWYETLTCINPLIKRIYI
jgi:alanine racemase